MAKPLLSQQLDDAVEAMLKHPGAALRPVDDPLAPLVRLAAMLGNHPSPTFREQLKAELTRRPSMTTATADFKRSGFQSVTPYLTSRKAPELIDFVKSAFGAVELMRGGPGSEGGIHCEVRVGDSMLMIGGGGAWRGTPMPTALHLYVPDADAVYRRALAAGATSVRVPVDQPYGDREATVEDLAGNHWYIATHLGGRHIPEGLRSVTPFLHPRGADEYIAFLKRGLGAEETACFRTPDGNIAHAVITIGDSVVEMGEAHGDAQPRPTMFYFYVDDVDAWHERALGAGASLLSPPANQPYGDRVGAVTDPIGNLWYLATHIQDVVS